MIETHAKCSYMKPECGTDTTRRYTDTAKVSHEHSQSAMQAQPEFHTNTLKVRCRHSQTRYRKQQSSIQTLSKCAPSTTGDRLDTALKKTQGALSESRYPHSYRSRRRRCRTLHRKPRTRRRTTRRHKPVLDCRRPSRRSRGNHRHGCSTHRGARLSNRHKQPLREEKLTNDKRKRHRSRLIRNP